ncbi:hypothetical protein Tco_0359033 [Tanacetum coccineum]
MLFSSVMVLMLAGLIFLLIIPPPLPQRMLVYLLQLWTKLFASNSEPMVVRKRTNDVKGSADDVNDVDNQDDAHYHSSLTNFDLVRSFDLPGHASVAQGGFCLFPLKDFPFMLVRNLLYSPLDVVEDDLAQGVEGFGLMQNEDHQVLGNEQKLEEDAPDCTRVDDNGVEFSPEGVDYFPTMGDETKKDKCSIFFLLFIQGAGLDELKHDLSTKEYVAHKCKNEIVENEHEIMSLYGANIEPNMVDPEEVADLDPDQLPTSASVVLVSSIVPISSLLHKTFAHTSVPNVSKVNKTTKSSVLWELYSSFFRSKLLELFIFLVIFCPLWEGVCGVPEIFWLLRAREYCINGSYLLWLGGPLYGLIVFHQLLSFPFWRSVLVWRDGGLIFSRMMSDLDVLLWWGDFPSF